ncbi:MAG: hypothetical protein JO320_24365 [Alphaproteobacteria bacterium]|nr:hypothetical protein [Alphaproteobacteria bacterium]MBV9378138.1 hypothetical protein [Alphaproteobacteria bacterium]
MIGNDGIKIALSSGLLACRQTRIVREASTIDCAESREAGSVLGFLSAGASPGPALAQTANLIGKEISVPVHLQDGKELETSIPDLIAFGEKLFTARWTSQEGQGRPLTKGTGSPLAEPNSPLVFPRNFDRMSGPDSNSCAGCHNTPFGGGGGDRVSEVFVLGQRFDF